MEEFLQESLKLQGLEHPNLLTVLGIVVDQNRPFMVLPLMDYGDMRKFLSSPDQVALTVAVVITT